MEGRSVDKASQFCDFNSAATGFYKQQLIPAAIFTGKRAELKEGQFDRIHRCAMNVCLKARDRKRIARRAVVS